jgi:urea transport system permease protein
MPTMSRCVAIFRRLLALSGLALVIASATGAVQGAPLVPADLIHDLALGENDAKVKAMGALVATGSEGALEVLQALQDGEIQTAGDTVLRIKGDKATDLATGNAVVPLPPSRDDVVLNNRVRRELATAIATLKLAAPDRAVRLAAAQGLQSGADEDALPAIERALAKEQDPEIKGLLTLTRATVQLGGTDKAKRIAAIRALAESRDPNTKTLLLPLVEKKGGEFVETDSDVRAEAELSLRAIEGRLATGEMVGRMFSGVSLGSVLLLAALGLAITYGLMGVINMAHGELMMIGAYATYVIQNLFRSHLPGAFDWYLVAAVPVAFATSALVGMALERSVIRFLYGRPLETLLATWGISLILIQAMRTVFGAQNVQVENPAWMSGGIHLFSNLVLPWNRIVIIGFAAAVVALIAALLTRTRLGLFVRGVTQNRSMASSLGVPTGRVDTYAFGLGSGIAGLAGCALSQIGNVGPDLGQTYIVDSFMVVVLGGVGQLAGTVYAAMGLGIVNKFLEAWSGAVLAKIAVLVFIIVFIQKRPQGLFALKGRMAES